MAIFVTSDLHFSHIQPFCWEARGYESPEQMNSEQIRKWNEVVTDEDEVWMLGDGMMNDNDAGVECFKQLKGKIHVIAGNHDTDARIQLYRDLGYDVQFAHRMKYKKKSFILSHYPMLTGNGEDKCWMATWNLHGHSHQSENFTDEHRFMYHVGVDSHNGYPVKLDDIIEEISAHWKNLEMRAQEENNATT